MGRRSKPWYREHDGWWVTTIKGEPYKLAKGQGSEKKALKRFHQIMAEADSPAEPEPDLISLVALSEAHAEAMEPEVKPSTFANYRLYIGSFIGHAGKATAAESIRPHHVEAWLKAQARWGQSTRRLAITTVRTLFAWGKAQGHIGANPLEGMKRPPAVARSLAMDATTYQRIMDSIEGRGASLKLFLEFMHLTGCRPSEAMWLEAKDIDFGAAVASFAGKTTKKTGKKRKIHLTARALEICREQAAAYPAGPIFRNAKGKPWTRNLLNSRFYWIRKRLNLPDGTSPETLRHGWVTDALVEGVPIATVAELAGHCDTTMISRVYSKLNERTDHLHAAAKTVRPDPDQ